MKVEIMGWYGGDKAIARAAWTSTQIDIDSKSEGQIEDLIVNKLWNNGSGKPHKTPFERGIVEFNVICDQASHIHLLKHRLANINGESARYKELKEDKYHVPLDWDEIQLSKESCNSVYGIDSYRIFDLDIVHTDQVTWRRMLKAYSDLGNKLYHGCLKDLTSILGKKRAKESARFFKTMNSEITLSVMMNMSCFYNFQTLRNDEAAQKEIREIAQEMLNQVQNIEGNPFKYTLKAFQI